MIIHSMEPFESSENFNEDVSLFEAATHCSLVKITPPACRTIVIAADGSPRDQAMRDYAAMFSGRTSARVEVLPISSNAAEVLESVKRLQADLLILPVPFGLVDLEHPARSIGKIAEELLVKTPCPVLCVRASQSETVIRESLQSIIISITAADEWATRALGWAFAVTPHGGRLDLVAVADHELISQTEQTQPSTQADENEHLSRSLISQMGGLIAAAQKQGMKEGRTVHVETRVGNFVPLTLAELHGRPHLIIWGIPEQENKPTPHQVSDLLLASKGGVLIV